MFYMFWTKQISGTLSTIDPFIDDSNSDGVYCVDVDSYLFSWFSFGRSKWIILSRALPKSLQKQNILLVIL